MRRPDECCAMSVGVDSIAKFLAGKFARFGDNPTLQFALKLLKEFFRW
jgi:hypothetical protein